jgi:hypothetical protein
MQLGTLQMKLAERVEQKCSDQSAITRSPHILSL